MAMMIMMTVRRHPHQDRKPSPQRARGAQLASFCLHDHCYTQPPSLSPHAYIHSCPCRVSVFYMSCRVPISLCPLCVIGRFACYTINAMSASSINHSSLEILLNACVNAKSNFTYISLMGLCEDHHCCAPQSNSGGDRKTVSFNVATAARAALCSAPSPLPPPPPLASCLLSPVSAGAARFRAGASPSEGAGAGAGGAMPNPAFSAATRTSGSRRRAVPSARSRAQNAAARARSSGMRWVAAVLRRRMWARESWASEVWARRGRVVLSGGAGGVGGAGRRCTESGRARKRACRRDQRVSCHCVCVCVCLCSYRGGEGERLLYHYDVVRGVALVFRTGRDADVRRVGPVCFREGRDDEEHEPDTAPRFARRTAHRHQAEHARRQGIRQQGGRERVQRVVGLRCAVCARLQRALAEAAIRTDRSESMGDP